MGGLKAVPSPVVWSGLTGKTIGAAHPGQKGKGGGNSAETQRHSVGDRRQAPLPQPCGGFQPAHQAAMPPAQVTTIPPPRALQGKGVGWVPGGGGGGLKPGGRSCGELLGTVSCSS